MQALGKYFETVLDMMGIEGLQSLRTSPKMDKVTEPCDEKHCGKPEQYWKDAWTLLHLALAIRGPMDVQGREES